MSLRPFLALAVLLVSLAPAAVAQNGDTLGRADPNRGYQDVGGGATPVGVNATRDETPSGGFVEESRDNEGAPSWLPLGAIFLFLIAITMVVAFMRMSRRR